MNRMNHKEAKAYIEEIPKFTRKHPLEHTKEFLRRLGYPAEDRKIVHVAGTNGKGSVCAYLQSILIKEGKKVGMFTSPHLISVNERIRIQGVPIDDNVFIQAFESVQKVAAQMKAEGLDHPSYFEFLYGMGMTAFAQSDIEYILLETGLGGRLDATNSNPHPCLSILTSISLDHTNLLGDTITKVAGEKAGIIRKGVPVIFDGSEEEASLVIRERAELQGAPCREISKNAFEIREVTPKSIAFSRAYAYDKDVVWTIRQCGVYQIRNAGIAIEAAEFLLASETVHKERWQEALESVRWEGRMEEVRPHLVVDGAHNIGAIEAFADSLERMYQGDTMRPVIVFAVAADKDYEQMIACLCRRIEAAAFIITEIDDKRKISVKELCKVFRKYIEDVSIDKRVFCEPELETAIRRAYEIRTSEGGGDIYCLGSLYLVGMVKSMEQNLV